VGLYFEGSHSWLGRQVAAISQFDRCASAGASSMTLALSYAHGTSAEPLLGETIGANLRRTVERLGQREALVVRHQATRLTYAELWEETGRVARGLMALGIAKGDRVGIWAPNCHEWIVVQYATARIGAILVNINPAYKAVELEYVLNQAGVSVLLLAKGFRQTDYCALLAQVRPACPGLRQTVVLDHDWQALRSGARAVNADELLERESSLHFDEAINIQYTSGTTGFPKGATLSHHNILNNGWFVGLQLGYGECDRVCIPVPFYHCFGMVLANLACTSTGACMVVPGECFDPLTALETVQAEGCTALYGVPTMFIAELDHPRFREFNVSSLRTGIMAGAPCPVELMNRVVTDLHMPEVAIGYGMTETSPISTMTARDDPLMRRVGTVGRVFPHVEIKIIDAASGSIVPRGTPGELCTRGYSVMIGYWNNSEATAASIDSRRWMHSGDLAVIDEEGYVNIVGRIKDMIIRGGENISPREIEEFLHTHPQISQAQVIGVPSVKYGEEVMAWVIPRRGCELSPEALTRFCTGKIATFKVPRWWKLVESFPMTVTGKVQKYRMREMAIQELKLADAAAVKTA
jgi:fatty-acyl-CoA synthase